MFHLLFLVVLFLLQEDLVLLSCILVPVTGPLSCLPLISAYLCNWVPLLIFKVLFNVDKCVEEDRCHPAGFQIPQSNLAYCMRTTRQLTHANPICLTIPFNTKMSD